MAKEKVDTKNWETCPIEKWNGTTFRNYIKHLNVQRFGIPSVTGSVQIENSQIKNFTKEYGNEVTKRFVEECVKTYSGNNPQYPTVNFMFMIRYMKERNLPKVLGETVKQNKLQKLREQLKEEQTDVEDYF